MQYVTQEQLDSFLNDRSLKALAGAGGTIDAALLEKVNADAVAEIDGYLRGIYPLPLAVPVDPLVTSICGDIMKFRLLKRRDESAMPENVLEMYKLAVKKLEGIQKRVITLAVAVEGSEEPSVASNPVVFKTPKQKFGEGFTGFSD